jgi:hypothetical protein
MTAYNAAPPQERAIATKGLNFVWVAWVAGLFWKTELATLADMRAWKALFGCSPLICDTIWGTLHLQNIIPPKTDPAHLLWVLYFLKTYGTEPVCGSFVSRTAKTFREHLWPLIEAMSAMRVVRQFKVSPVTVILTLSFSHFRSTLRNGSYITTEAGARSLSMAPTSPSWSHGLSTLSGTPTS